MPGFLDDRAVAVVIGASGGIGQALAEALAESTPVGAIFVTGRRPPPTQHPKLHAGALDLDDERSIAAAAAAASALGEVRMVCVATGMLHAEGLAPEKTWRSLDRASLLRVFEINSIGPALVAKHFLPLFPRRGRAVFAALSARVGSISDNQLGGWYAYRASKAALNMLLRTLALELGRRAPEAVCVGLHPGTVDTALSRPFQGNVAPGKLFTPQHAAAQLLRVIEGLTPAESGRVFAWDGAEIPP